MCAITPLAEEEDAGEARESPPGGSRPCCRIRHGLVGPLIAVISWVCSIEDDAPAHASFAGRRYPLCSDPYRERFDANPEHFAADGARPEGMPVEESVAVIPRRTPLSHEGSTVIDPVCGMTVEPATAAAHRGTRMATTGSAIQDVRRLLTPTPSTTSERLHARMVTNASLGAPAPTIAMRVDVPVPSRLDGHSGQR